MIGAAGFAACTVVLLIDPLVASPAGPIPPAKRITASVVRTLAAPADDPMRLPTDVAVDPEGRTFVADGVNNRIVRFSRDGRFDGAIAAPGGLALNQPVGLTTDNDGRLWIADTGNHRIIVAATDGRLLEHFDLDAADGGRAFDATDIAVTADGKRTYIVDNDNHRLAIRSNADGNLTFLGKFGDGLGHFKWPFMVCIAPNGYVYVSESMGARVQRISPADRWSGQIGQWGVELGQLYRPKGIATDADARVCVGDSTLGVIQMFDARGATIGVLCDRQGGILKFEHPMGMCFDKSGRLYVVELAANRVAVVAMDLSPVQTTRPRENARAGDKP